MKYTNGLKLLGIAILTAGMALAGHPKMVSGQLLQGTAAVRETGQASSEATIIAINEDN